MKRILKKIIYYGVNREPLMKVRYLINWPRDGGKRTSSCREFLAVEFPWYAMKVSNVISPCLVQSVSDFTQPFSITEITFEQSSFQPPQLPTHVSLCSCNSRTLYKWYMLTSLISPIFQHIFTLKRDDQANLVTTDPLYIAGVTGILLKNLA